MNTTETLKRVYTISEKDKEKIQNLLIRKNGIRELMDTAVNNQALYEKLRDDYVDVSARFQQWFADFEKNYQAAGAEGHYWNVDFANNTVLLTKIDN